MKQRRLFSKILKLVMIAVFTLQVINPYIAYAQNPVILPSPIERLSLSEHFSPAMIRGMKFDLRNGLKMSLIVDEGDERLDVSAMHAEAEKMIKYFLTSLTVPEKDLWVNLSPYEKDRITTSALARTDMGRELLAQDYLLKKITASLIFPEDETGKKFWEKIQQRMYERWGMTDVPVNAFHKIWIMPDEAEVFAQDDTVVILNSRLKVMLEEDYLAKTEDEKRRDMGAVGDHVGDMDPEVKQVLREVVIPVIEDEVNHGKNFSELRRIYHALIMAKWFKQNLKQSVLGQVYADQSKVDGIDQNDARLLDDIYNRYVEAFRAGSDGVIKENYDPSAQKLSVQKYVTGGFITAGMEVKNRAMLISEVLRRFQNVVEGVLSLVSFEVEPLGGSLGSSMSRRDFLKLTALGGIALGLPEGRSMLFKEDAFMFPDVRTGLARFFTDDLQREPWVRPSDGTTFFGEYHNRQQLQEVGEFKRKYNELAKIVSANKNKMDVENPSIKAILDDLRAIVDRIFQDRKEEVSKKYESYQALYDTMRSGDYTHIGLESSLKDFNFWNRPGSYDTIRNVDTVLQLIMDKDRIPELMPNLFPQAIYADYQLNRGRQTPLISLENPDALNEYLSELTRSDEVFNQYNQALIGNSQPQAEFDVVDLLVNTNERDQFVKLRFDDMVQKVNEWNQSIVNETRRLIFDELAFRTYKLMKLLMMRDFGVNANISAFKQVNPKAKILAVVGGTHVKSQQYIEEQRDNPNFGDEVKEDIQKVKEQLGDQAMLKAPSPTGGIDFDSSGMNFYSGGMVDLGMMRGTLPVEPNAIKGFAPVHMAITPIADVNMLFGRVE